MAFPVAGKAQEKIQPGAIGQHLGPQPPGPPARFIDWSLNESFAASHAGWRAFAERHAGWRANFDERTGQPEFAYGPGIQITSPEPATHEIAVAAKAVRDEIVPLAGHDPAAFELFSVLPAGNISFVHFIQRFHGLQVMNARLKLCVDQSGRLVSFTFRPVDVSSLVFDPVVGGEEAKSLARAHLERLGYLTVSSKVGDFGAEALIHVSETLTGFTPTPAWRVSLVAETPRADWLVFVDQRTGGIVDYWNDLRECGPPNLESLGAVLSLAQINGVVQGTTHEGLLPSQAPATRNFPEVRLTCNGTTVTTDSTGAYAFNGGGATIPVTSTLDGPWISANSTSGIPANFSGTAASGVFDVVFTDTNSNIGERDMVYFTNKAHKVLKQNAPTITLLDNAITANANVSGSCNAFYSPAAHSINFYVAAGSCINTATSASVVEHEYGHGVTTRVYNAAGFSVPGYMGEGLADCQGGACEDTNIVGAGFQGPGTMVRNMDNTCQYPTSCGTEVHARGLLIGGCYWHTRVQFFNAFGAAGKAQMDGYLYRHFLGAPQNEIESVTDMLALDDNDGNLANGTPNMGKFYTGYTTLHGVPFPIQLISITHQPLFDTLDQHQAYQVHCTASSITGGALASMTLNWRLSGAGAFTVVNMTNQGGGAYMASIPVQASGASIEYYLRAQDSGGSAGFNPPGAPGATHSFATAISSSFFSDGFEGTATWTSVLVAGQNDWQNNSFGNPAHAYDPPTAFQGVKVWGNDLSPSGFNGLYANNVNNHLTSPVINCTGRTGVNLVYRRWLTVEDGLYDQARILVSNNNGTTFTQVWQNAATAGGTQNHIDTSWVEHTVSIAAIADNQPNVRIRFQLQSDAGLTFGGWNIDDLRLTAANVGAGTVLTSSGSTAVGQVLNLHVNGTPGDFALVGADGFLSTNYYPGIGTMSLNVFSPSFIFLLPGVVVPAGGQYTLPITVPPAAGLTARIQGVLVKVSPPGELVISNVLSVTLTP